MPGDRLRWSSPIWATCTLTGLLTLGQGASIDQPRSAQLAMIRFTTSATMCRRTSGSGQISMGVFYRRPREPSAFSRYANARR